MGVENSTLLVTGASGRLGRRIVEILLEQGVSNLIATSRTSHTLVMLALHGATVRAADFDNPASLDPAFAGADRLLIVSTDQLTKPGQRQRQRQHRAALNAAIHAGVRHVCYTSMPKPEPGSPVPFAPDHHAMEQDLAASGIDYSVLRNSWYFENLLLLLPYVLATGQWYTSARGGQLAYVAREDAARAAAGALQSATGQRVFDITGPQAMTVDEIALLASRVFGVTIEVVQLPDEALADALTCQGVPEFYAPMVVITDANQRVNGFTPATTAVKELTGRDPMPLEQFLHEHRAEFIALRR